MTRRSSSIIRIVAAILVAAALAIWCMSRWDTWFQNPEEAPYTASPVPARVLLTFGDIDDLNRNVSWTCGEDVRDSYIDLYDRTDRHLSRVKAEGESFVSRSGKAAYYVGRLRHLQYGLRIAIGCAQVRRSLPGISFQCRRRVRRIYPSSMQATSRTL